MPIPALDQSSHHRLDMAFALLAWHRSRTQRTNHPKPSHLGRGSLCHCDCLCSWKLLSCLGIVEIRQPKEGGKSMKGSLIDPRQGLATHQITDADSCKHDSNNNEHKSLFFEWQRYRYYLKRKKYPNKIIYLFVGIISLTSENTFF